MESAATQPLIYTSTMNTEADLPLVLHIDNMGRFGNYYYAKGWHTGSKFELQQFSYELPSPHLLARPEYAYYLGESGSPDPHEPRKRFLHFFWVNDGYLAEVSEVVPIRVSILAIESVETITSTRFHKLQDANMAEFLETLIQAKSKEAWSNRVVLEMVSDRFLEDQFAFFTAAVDACGWTHVHGVLREHCARLDQVLAARLLLQYYTQWTKVTDVAYLPHDLKEAFLQVLEVIDYTGCDFDFAEQVTTQLARFALPDACRFARKIIDSRKLDSHSISQLLHPCLPHHSQWWMRAALVSNGLGSEQMAEALNVAGYAAASQHQNELAELCYVAALAIKPDAQSAAWNLGWLHAHNGDVAAADKAFSCISRHYPNQSLCTAWPIVCGAVWPGSAQDTSGYRLPEGSASWPRISIVTPSYNQGQYIEETILSVLNQNYPNLQYIVVDGNSTDDTRDVLEQYRSRIDHLIIESDNGQTEAINKGFRLVDGDIIAWLNSDDIYAPGSLHAAALAWLANKADVIAGQCLEHTDRRFLLINKPAARNLDFNPPQLARIFKYWLKGHYFYQPEVFFSKRILDKVGLLDESLYYSMDYDLWMRFAIAGASLEVIDWPVAFFRKHDAQKTTNLIDCIEEQARVRSSHYKLVPGDERQHQIMRGLLELRDRKKITVGILTKRIGKIFSKSAQQELDAYVDGKFHCRIGDDVNHPDIAQADLVILLVHVLDDLDTIARLRKSRADRPIIGWFWDNHHHLFDNYPVAEALDVVIPGHALYSEYLRNDRSILSDHVSLCVTQWARHDAAEWFARYNGTSRNPDLYGGFVDYHFEPQRTEFLRNVMSGIPTHALGILSEENLKDYFGRSEEERFAEWCSYQTSLVLPLRNDLSQRVFDALLTGQIPLVPEEIRDMDTVIPRELQESLPIIRFSMKNPGSCLQAYNTAVELAARDGLEGCIRRHEYALENAMFSKRISMVLESAFQLGLPQPPFPS